LEEPTPARKIEMLRAANLQIKDMNTGVKWVNLMGKIVEKSITRKVFSRFDDPLDVSTATVSDNTGSIKLALWNAKIDMISVGDVVQIQNGRIKMFKGKLQVSVGRAGKLKVVEGQQP